MEFLELIMNLTWPSIVCFILGLVFVIFEMFHPGFGAPGIIGGILLVLSIILAAHSVFQALIMIVIILAILGITLTIVLHSATKGYIARNLVLYDSLNKSVNNPLTDDLIYFMDKEGTALTVLRPSGSADFDGIKLDVVTEGDFIPQGSKVRIVKTEGHRIVVRQINNP